MAFDPFKEKGRPIEKQVRNWEELNVQPYDPESVHPYTRTRIILMNGIETEAALFLHQFARHASDSELKQKIALARRVEQQQQKLVNWLVPASESALEVTLGYEQVAVDLTAWLARTEPDPYVKAALDYALLEDFDHLYRYSNHLELAEGKDPARIVGDLTEIFPGRPTAIEHQHPFDTVRRHYDARRADVLTKMHVATIVAGEQQTMNFYMNVGNRSTDMLGRGLYLEIAQIEEQHVTHYESLADPSASWLEMLLIHEYNECYLYYSCLESETDARVRKIWQQCLEDELEHLRVAGELLMRHEGRDPAGIFPGEFPELTVFKSNKDYVRQVLAEQEGLSADGPDFVPRGKLGRDSRFRQFQDQVNSASVPSREVVARHIRKDGRDYRLETEGQHPVERLRARDRVSGDD